MKSDNLKIGDQVVVYEPLDCVYHYRLEDWEYECEGCFIARIEGFNKEKNEAFLSMVYMDALTNSIEMSSGVEDVCHLTKATKAEVEAYSKILYKYYDQFKT